MDTRGAVLLVTRRHDAARRVAAAAALAVAVVAAGCGGDDARRDQAQRTASSAVAVPAPSAATVQRQFVSVVRRVSPSVVQLQTSSGLGSGVVFDDRGHIVTNAHVVGDATRLKVTLASGERHDATLVGMYPQNDLAVVRVTGAKPPPAVFADSARIEVGQFTLAIGSPLGLRSSVTDGIVSSVGRTVPEGNGVVIPSAIQTSAPINPGNSGGALVDLEGKVIGVPTLAAADPELGAQAPGIGFAIPSNTVKTIAGKLIASGRVPFSGRAYLGVQVSTSVGGGVVVEAVEPEGPADRGGVRPGDVIIALAGQETPTADVLSSVLQTLRPEQTVPVQVVHRSGEQETVQVTLGQQPGR